MGRATSIALRQTVVFCTLLFALVLSGSVPQGYMQSTNGDGMAIVLCTTNGPIEVWQTAQGEVMDAAPADHSSTDIADCLAITLSLVLVQSRFEALAQPVEFSPYHTTFIDRRGALISARTPLQPRAPPVLI